MITCAAVAFPDGAWPAAASGVALGSLGGNAVGYGTGLAPTGAAAVGLTPGGVAGFGAPHSASGGDGDGFGEGSVGTAMRRVQAGSSAGPGDWRRSSVAPGVPGGVAQAGPPGAAAGGSTGCGAMSGGGPPRPTFCCVPM